MDTHKTWNCWHFIKINALTYNKQHIIKTQIINILKEASCISGNFPVDWRQYIWPINIFSTGVEENKYNEQVPTATSSVFLLLKQLV